jgi:hypothetical protein
MPDNKPVERFTLGITPTPKCGTRLLQSDLNFHQIKNAEELEGFHTVRGLPSIPDDLAVFKVACDMCGRPTPLLGSFATVIRLSEQISEEKSIYNRLIVCSEKCLTEFKSPSNKEEVEDYINDRMAFLHYQAV